MTDGRPEEPVLQARRVGYAAGGATLLRDISLSLAPGRVYALIGPNGAGKSTLLKLLAGDVAPTEGELLLRQRPLRQYSKRELALQRAVMPQDVLISLGFTGEEVVMMGRYPHMAGKSPTGRDPDRNHREAVRQRMEQTETTPLKDRLYPSLSGGEQARVTLARVLAQDAPLLFLDEPTASLDPRHQHLVMTLAKAHAARGGTVLAVLHDMNLAAAYADDVFLLAAGRLVAEGPPEEVLRPPVLEGVFQTKFYVFQHPRASHPLVLSLPPG